MSKPTSRPKSFYVQFALWIIIFLVNTISLITPYWFQTKAGTANRFQNLGLWEVCFDHFFHSYYHQREYIGCFYIYYYKFDIIQQWLVPGWFVITQIIFTLSYICIWAVGVIFTAEVVFFLRRNNFTSLKISIALLIASDLGQLLSLIIFGAGANNNNDWLPSPDTLVLSIAYWLVLLSFLLGVALTMMRGLTFRQLKQDAVAEKRTTDLEMFPHDGDGQSYYVPSTIPQSPLSASITALNMKSNDHLVSARPKSGANEPTPRAKAATLQSPLSASISGLNNSDDLISANRSKSGVHPVQPTPRTVAATKLLSSPASGPNSNIEDRLISARPKSGVMVEPPLLSASNPRLNSARTEELISARPKSGVISQPPLPNSPRTEELISARLKSGVVIQPRLLSASNPRLNSPRTEELISARPKSGVVNKGPKKPVSSLLSSSNPTLNAQPVARAEERLISAKLKPGGAPSAPAQRAIPAKPHHKSVNSIHEMAV